MLLYLINCSNAIYNIDFKYSIKSILKRVIIRVLFGPRNFYSKQPYKCKGIPSYEWYILQLIRNNVILMFTILNKNNKTIIYSIVWKVLTSVTHFFFLPIAYSLIIHHPLVFDVPSALSLSLRDMIKQVITENLLLFWIDNDQMR